jgi:NDP-sugar pyrophosphorylase family protein
LTATNSIAHALVLSAGLGTRLRPLTLIRAKPAIPVAGDPLVRRILRWLVASGVSNVTVNLHYLPETITTLVGDGSDLNARVRYSWEQPAVLGSAGGPRQALEIIGADTFLLVNGDTLTDLDVPSLCEAHLRSGALITMALVPNVDPRRYGGVQLAADGRVTGFARRGPAASGSFHFIGVQVAHRSAFAGLPAGQPINSVGGCYDELLAREPDRIRGFVTQAGFWDIGTVADYWQTSMAWSSHPDGTSAASHVAPTATVMRSILWDDVTIGPDARVAECIVTDGVQVPAGLRYYRQILMRAPDGATVVEPLDVNGIPPA